ncbi:MULTISPECIES: tripartite tricarboxylate transporter substrate-binding protein [unclassified Beijerinckia]|uniref:Bug family tripartite tricarboxylate transporter substrate binding protein n=1 Tax=unclassified Beijerinckia TaxID=2638183 RepID=UPI0008995EA4|nr:MULTISPECIES: tripartite tricarboxylate transporter substrate-binding protein [unclassified Beijerinckia]MDH7795161.1 tripartite-type tricarboxylate transporter receptor subunit TctC [Beijerinckia sp. GAS462]SEB90076.1 Tripartite-type tricarboxylate transporter, receptor component TctC [Beijerinckia sp. 28-YEA-48]
MKRLILTAAALIVSATGIATGVLAQTYPDKVVRMVVPFPAGGSYDVIARLIGAGLGERWGQQIVIDNKGGAAGEIGAAAVATAAPDGYTLLLFGDGILINQGLMKNRAFHPLKSFSPVTLVARSPQVLVASQSLNVTSLTELVARSKAGKLDLPFGTAGSGTPGHLAAELLAAKSGLPLRHVPYRGGAPALADLLGNHLGLVSTGLPALIGSIQSGSIIPLAVSSEKRSTLLPNVPAMNESVPGVFLDTWYGILAPAGLPDPIAQKIYTDVSAVMRAPEMSTKLAEQGFEFVGGSPEELKGVMERDLPRWQEVIDLAGIKPGQ